MSTHLELLEQYAAKLAALAQDRRTVSAQDWGEFVYPLERGRDFARIATKRYPDRLSLARFEDVLARYGEMVASPGVLTRGDAERILRSDKQRLDEAIAATRRELEREAGGSYDSSRRADVKLAASAQPASGPWS
jgi:hypothetical protein